MADIVCPSGLAGEVRGLTVKDGKYLTDRSVARSGMVADKILGSCWRSTSDPGVYPFDGDVDWSKVLIGDRDFALMKIRIAGIGEDYEFKVQCANCQANFVWEIDLNELPVHQLSEESKKILRERGNIFDGSVTVDGKTIPFTFRLPTGELVARQMKRRANRSKVAKRKGDDEQQDNLMFDAIDMRLIDIGGVTTASERRDFIESLSFRQMRDLLAQFERVDCGVDTAIEIECPGCARIWELNLPFDEAFLFPKMKKAVR